MLKLNVGLSNESQDFDEELAKVKVGLENNIDYISVISVDKSRTKEFWEAIAKLFKEYRSTHKCSTVLCSAPIYETVMFDEIPMETITRHASYHVRAMTFHITPYYLIKKALSENFVINSRGGQFIQEWGKNFYYEYFKDLVNFAVVQNGIKKIFLGTSLRPGACTKMAGVTADELKIACNYYDHMKKFSKADCEIETFGHVSVSEFPLYHAILGNRPLCSMGPLLTDAVNGYDELNAIIGYSMALKDGFNIKTECMLSRSEHIKMPDLNDVQDEIQKWQVARFINKIIIGDENAIKKEEEITGKHKQQREQCSAHINIFGAMDIQATCDLCGAYCPLKNGKQSA